MKIRNLGLVAGGLAIVVVVALILTFGNRMRDRLAGPSVPTNPPEQPAPANEVKTLKLGESARKNLGLIAKAIKPQSYWRTIQVPGVVTDRPGFSDRGITSPAVGAVAQVHAFPGDTVRPGDRLFTLRLFSEYLQNTQAELFKATRESQLIADQKSRIDTAVRSGAVSEMKLIELDNQAKRQATAIQGFRQDLLTRGLTREQMDGVADGRFVSTLEVVAPLPNQTLPGKTVPASTLQNTASLPDPFKYEVQELRVELGQQVQAGQLLSMLSNHKQLFIEGHAFKREASLLSNVAEKNWPIDAEFVEDDGETWPMTSQKLLIRHLANAIDPESRTLSFFVPLENQSRGYEKDGQFFSVWRFRPGQRVRLHIPIEELQDVLVLPSAAIVREGPEAYVFQQNGDLFNRIAVHVLHQDRLHVVFANDGGITPGLYLAQNSAAALNRVLKAQMASGVRADIHVHADGTTHAAH